MVTICSWYLLKRPLSTQFVHYRTPSSLSISHPVISRWSWAGRVFSRFIPTIILSGSSAQYLLAHAKSSRHHLGRECLPSEPGVACQISQGSRSCRTVEVQSRAPFQGLLPRAAAVTRQMLAAAPLQDQVRALAKTQTSASFQEEKYELASNRKICHLELSFSSVEWPVLVNAVG